MAQIFKTLSAIGFVAVVSACGYSSGAAVEEEIVYVDPVPVIVEPETHGTGKYK